MKEKINNILIMFLKYFKNYVKHNQLLVFFVLSNVINGALVRILSIGSWLNISPYLADLSIILGIASFSFFLKAKYRYRYFIISSILITAIYFVNVVYYGYYASFISAQMLQMLGMLEDVSGSLTFNVFQIQQFLILFQPVALYLYMKKLRRDKKIKLETYKRVDLNYWRQTIIVLLVFIAIFFSTLEGKDYSRLVKQWNREYIVGKFGILVYQVNDLVKSVEPKISSMFGYDTALKVYKDYYDNKNTAVAPNKYTDIFQGKNLLLIHTESIQQNIIGLKFNGQEVTPNLNKLAKESMYFENFYAQTSVGTSSDAEYIINNSLLPVSNGTVFVSYGNRKFNAMPGILSDKGYTTFCMHANNGTFWNRKTVYKNFGYNRFYDKAYYEIDDELGLGLSDESFFRQSLEKLKKIEKPFYGTMIMLSNHTPFVESAERSELDLTMKYKDPKTGEELIAPYMENTRLGQYFKSSNYADKTIGDFINNLDKEGLLDDTVVVFYGDHDAKLPKSDYRRMINYDPITNKTIQQEDDRYKEYPDYQYELNRKVVFMIYAKDKRIKKKITTATGMIDVMPILGNMFGFTNPYQMGKDTTVLSDNLVALPNGNWISNKGYFQKALGETLVNGFTPFNNSYVSNDYLEKNTAETEKMIDVSNAIVVYNLIAKNPLSGGRK